MLLAEEAPIFFHKTAFFDLIKYPRKNSYIEGI